MRLGLWTVDEAFGEAEQRSERSQGRELELLPDEHR